MNELEEERFRREALFAPVRMLAGLVSGSVIGIIAFGLAWLPFWPSSFEGTLEALILLGIAGLIAGAFGALMLAVKPLRAWWQLILCVALGSVAGLLAGWAMRSAILGDCLHGTGPQERWCDASYSFLPLFLGNILAAAIVATVLSALGVRTASLPDPG